MYSTVDNPEEKSSKGRNKSRKSVKNRNNSILSSFAKESVYDQSLCQSRISIYKSSTDTSEVEKSRVKMKELSEENSNLRDLIQSNERELDFFNKIINQFLDVNELLKIKQKSLFDENSRTWNIPDFMVQQRKTVFPKLQKSQLKEVLQSEMKQRKIVFKKKESPCGGVGKGDESNGREPETFFEGEGRPVTSVSKYRQCSMNNKGMDSFEGNRRSPALRKPKLKV